MIEIGAETFSCATRTEDVENPVDLSATEFARPVRLLDRVRQTVGNLVTQLLVPTNPKLPLLFGEPAHG
jgi:hypothetical protein